MAPATPTVAILAANPALSSVLAAVLAASRGLRARAFESEAALVAYCTIAPVDLAVLDFDCAEAPAQRLAPELRRMPQLAGIEIIALGRRLPAGTGDIVRAAGIDEVLVKPMSPRLLLERVRARLRARGPRMAPMAGPGDWASYGPNIVPLFDAPLEPRH